MRLTRVRWVLIILTVAVAILSGRVGESVAVDKCLDNGGAWDYAIGRCEPNRSPPFPAPREGPPGARAWSQWAAVVGVAALLAIFGWRDRRWASRPDV
jgi:hypothetical protein